MTIKLCQHESFLVQRVGLLQGYRQLLPPALPFFAFGTIYTFGQKSL